MQIMPSGHAVVAGGAGFIGARLCAVLLESGWRVSCLDNLVSGNLDNLGPLRNSPAFHFIRHDVTEPLPDLGPVDAVFHLATMASPVDYLNHPIATLRSGSAGTERLLDLAQRERARFVLASTSEVYGDPLEHPQREDYWGNVNPIGPRSVYDEGKRYAEALAIGYARANGTDVGVARIFNSYGPGMRPDDGRMIPNFICQALRGEPLTIAGSGEQTRSVCFVDDTIAGLIALLHSKITGPVNLGNPDERTVIEIAELICRLSGRDVGLRHVDAAVDDPVRRCPDITLAREALGWHPTVPIEEGLQRTIAWFAARQPIPTGSAALGRVRNGATPASTSKPQTASVRRETA